MAIQLRDTTFELPPPKELDEATAAAFIRGSMLRIATSGTEQMAQMRSSNQVRRYEDDDEDDEEAAARAASEAAATSKERAINKGLPPAEMWMLLIVRMVTRGQRDAQTNLAIAESRDVKDENDMVIDLKGKGRAVDTLPRSDRLRQVISDYVLADFPARYVLFPAFSV